MSAKLAKNLNISAQQQPVGYISFRKTEAVADMDSFPLQDGTCKVTLYES